MMIRTRKLPADDTDSLRWKPAPPPVAYLRVTRAGKLPKVALSLQQDRLDEIGRIKSDAQVRTDSQSR